MAAELYGTLNASNAQEIARGFREGFEDTRTTLKYSLCGDFLRSRGYEIMEIFEQEYTGITLVLCQNDAMALGAIDYLNAQGLQPGVDVKLCVFGGGDEVQACREKGQIDLVAQCDNEAVSYTHLSKISSGSSESQGYSITPNEQLWRTEMPISR